jgi:hypothetical protein
MKKTRLRCGLLLELIEAAEYLVRIGSILGIVLGLISGFFWGYVVLLGIGPPYFAVNIYEILMLIASLFAIFFSYFVLSRFPKRIETNPFRSALHLVGLGIVIAIGSWGLAGLLIVIGAVLILIDETN